ncbi:hypothetical protein L1049_020779 [Liquidambar formosana]|uniref:Transmembrane protein n=1 Tax=Liquidambar formosana TaxID=63359 RepID=A0AAP0SBV8_LIQFO
MYRSVSSNRVSEDYYTHASSPGLRPSLEGDEAPLPLYDAVSEAPKKERSRIKFSENAVHLIPFVLFLCAIILWFLSNPDVDVRLKSDSIAARIEGLTIEGDIDNDSDGTQTGFLPVLDSEDMNQQKQTQDHKASRKTENRSK